MEVYSNIRKSNSLAINKKDFENLLSHSWFQSKLNFFFPDVESKASRSQKTQVDNWPELFAANISNYILVFRLSAFDGGNDKIEKSDKQSAWRFVHF